MDGIQSFPKVGLIKLNKKRKSKLFVMKMNMMMMKMMMDGWMDVSYLGVMDIECCCNFIWS